MKSITARLRALERRIPKQTRTFHVEEVGNGTFDYGGKNYPSAEAAKAVMRPRAGDIVIVHRDPCR